MTKRVFISHVSDEHAVAAALKAQMVKDFLGLLSVFVSSDGESIAAGEQWLTSIEKALAECDLLITVCSPHSIRRPWINFEAGAAWMRKIPLVPVCHAGLAPSDLPMPLSVRHGVSLGDAEGLRRVYTQLAQVLNCDPPQPDFKAIAQKLSGISKELQSVSRDDQEVAALTSSRAARNRLLEALRHPRFKWRSLDALASAAAISTDVAADLLRADASVRFSRGKSGSIIAGLRSRVDDASTGPVRNGEILDNRTRTLTSRQKERLITILRQTEFPPVIKLRYRIIDMEASQFAQEFREAFAKAGWKRVVNEYEYSDMDTRRGLFVETKWNHITPSGAHTLVGALKEIGLTVTLKTSRAVRDEADVVFFIGGIED